MLSEAFIATFCAVLLRCSLVVPGVAFAISWSLLRSALLCPNVKLGYTLRNAFWFSLIHFTAINERVSSAGVREFESPWPVKSYTALQTVRHHFNIYASCCCLALWRGFGHRKLVTTFRRNAASIRKGLALVFDNIMWDINLV